MPVLERREFRMRPRVAMLFAAVLMILALPASAAAAPSPSCNVVTYALVQRVGGCLAAPQVEIVGSSVGVLGDSLRFTIAGRGFRPSELVVLEGRYVPLQGGPGQAGCQSLPLGPLRVRADRRGDVLATLTAPNPGTGVNVAIRVIGAVSGLSALAVSYVTPDC